jgi:hypothetical protein
MQGLQGGRPAGRPVPQSGVENFERCASQCVIEKRKNGEQQCRRATSDSNRKLNFKPRIV